MTRTTNIPSLEDIIKQPVVSEMDLRILNDLEKVSLAPIGLQNGGTKKSSTPFPPKTFQTRSSILTDLLKVSHFRSIRQIFISILVIVFLQVAITDLFELGTYV